MRLAKTLEKKPEEFSVPLMEPPLIRPLNV